MANGIKKLKKDLDIIKTMVEKLTDYLNSEILFWPLFKADYPRMTLGSYLLRQRRLQILSFLLTNSEQAELGQIVTQYRSVAKDRKAHLMKKATEELNARIHQWEGHLQEYWDSDVIEKQYYASDVDVRTIIADLISELGLDLSKLDKNLHHQLDFVDDELKANWQDGDFIWPAGWIQAYGKGDYWWLYGTPISPNSE